MNNLYKKLKVDGKEYIVIHETNLNIALMNDDGIIRKQFRNNYALEDFIKTTQVTRRK